MVRGLDFQIEKLWRPRSADAPSPPPRPPRSAGIEEILTLFNL